MSQLVAIVGTDTGVGKTVVGAGLLFGLRKSGYRAAGFKVVETGVPETPRGASSRLADWERLEQASRQLPGSGLGLSYALPASPLAAARATGQSPSLATIEARLGRLRDSYDLVVVEGAGGIMVPLAEGLLWGDLLERWKPWCLLVGRLGLGTINHTLLSLEAMRKRHLDPMGVILCSTNPPGPEADSTPRLIEEFGNTSVICTLNWGVSDPEPVSDILSRSGLFSLLVSHRS